MSQPPPYEPVHAFVSDSATLANFPGQALDVEFAAISAVTGEIEDNLAEIQRDDGALANGVVTFDSLSADLQAAGLQPANAWVTGTIYQIGNAVIQNSSLYRCLIAHTATVFATDLAAGKWVLVSSLAYSAGTNLTLTGSVFAVVSSPTFTGASLGVATATSLNGNTFTSGTYTLSGAPGKTFTFSNTLTLVGTDGTTMTFPGSSATIARTDAGQTFAGTQVFGAITATSINGNTFTSGTYTLTGAAGKTLTFSNTLTLAGSDGTTMTLPSTSATIARTDAGQTFTGTNAFGVVTATTVNGATVSPGHHSGEPSTGSALAGEIGEYIASNVVKGSAISVTTGTPANLTSISLTAGDWDVYGNAYYLPAATTTVTGLAASISQTTATADMVTQGAFAAYRSGSYTPGNNETNALVGPVRISLAATTTVFFVIVAAFATSTMQCYGGIRARRAR